jgi:hypothetical protein
MYEGSPHKDHGNIMKVVSEKIHDIVEEGDGENLIFSD